MSDAPISTTSVTDAFALAEEIKTYKTTELISFLKLQNFELEEEDLEIIRKQRVNGCTFFKITKATWNEIGTCNNARRICQGV